MRLSPLPIAVCSLACAPAAWETETVQFDSGLVATDKDGDGWSFEEDCDDDNVDTHPDAIEICDGVDNNCDGLIDEDVGTTWYLDSDSDGYGDPDASTVSCDMPDGYVPTANDCSGAENLPAARRC